MGKTLKYWFEYIFFRMFVGLQAITPFWLMYLKSDVVAFLLYYIIRYRRDISYNNLKSSFPGKSPAEIKGIQKRFYRHLADVFYETAKGMTCSPAKLCRRYQITNPEMANKYAAEDTNVIFLATHYGNWEWGMQCFNRHLQHQCISLYLPLNNKRNERYGYKKRTRTGMKLIPVQETKKAFAENGGKALGIIMAADQTPGNMNKCHWIDFLNRPTPCIHGPEAYGRKLNIPLLFVDVNKVKRGHYEVTLKEIPFDPQAEPEGTLTCRYMKQLEAVLTREPAYWLWSHRRWKRNVPDDIDKIKKQCT